MTIEQGQKELAIRYAEKNHTEYGMSCSESVFNALIRSGVLDLPEDYTRIATGLAGGVGASGNTCGAIYGGLMALGWIYGRKKPLEKGTTDFSKNDGPENDYRNYVLRRFNCYLHEVEEHLGTTRCWDIVKGNGSYFADKRVMKCPEIIVMATEIVLKYLEMSEEENNGLPFGYNILGYE